MKYIVCTRNLEWVFSTNKNKAIGAFITFLLRRGYKRSFIEVFVNRQRVVSNSGAKM